MFLRTIDEALLLNITCFLTENTVHHVVSSFPKLVFVLKKKKKKKALVIATKVEEKV